MPTQRYLHYSFSINLLLAPTYKWYVDVTNVYKVPLPCDGPTVQLGRQHMASVAQQQLGTHRTRIDGSILVSAAADITPAVAIPACTVCTMHAL
jgi:hypothetical protein